PFLKNLRPNKVLHDAIDADRLVDDLRSDVVTPVHPFLQRTGDPIAPDSTFERCADTDTVTAFVAISENIGLGLGLSLRDREALDHIRAYVHRETATAITEVE